MSGLSRSLEPIPKVAIISSQVSEQRITPFVFRSYELPFRVYSSFNGSSKYPVWAGNSSDVSKKVSNFGQFASNFDIF